MESSGGGLCKEPTNPFWFAGTASKRQVSTTVHLKGAPQKFESVSATISRCKQPFVVPHWYVYIYIYISYLYIDGRNKNPIIVSETTLSGWSVRKLWSLSGEIWVAFHSIRCFFPTKDLETNPLNSTKFLCIYIYTHCIIYIYYDIYIYTCIIGECHETCIFFQGLKGLKGTLLPGPGTKLRSAIDEARQRIEAYEDRSAVT